MSKSKQYKSDARFRAQALRGKNARGLELLDKIDNHFGRDVRTSKPSKK